MNQEREGEREEQKKVEAGRDRVDSGSTGRSPSREGTQEREKEEKRGEIDWTRMILMDDTALLDEQEDRLIYMLASLSFVL